MGAWGDRWGGHGRFGSFHPFSHGWRARLARSLIFQQEPSYLRAESMHDTEGEIAEKLRGGSGDVRWLWLRDRFEFPLT
jgi:hypothetical protein